MEIDKYIINLDKDQVIYRYMKLDYLIDMLKNQRNILVKPKMWEDPFENLLYNTPYLSPSGNYLKLLGGDRHYGQCWTLKQESYAMWKLYCPDSCCVKIKSTVGKIFEPLYKICKEKLDYINQKPDNLGEGERFFFQAIIGKVEYLEEDELIAKLQDNYKEKATDTTQLGLLESFLVKRQPFDYEEEVRIIYDHFEQPCELVLKSYPIEPNDVIEQIVLNPYLETQLIEIISEKLRQFGYTNPIIKSNLLDIPNITFQIDKKR